MILEFLHAIKAIVKKNRGEPWEKQIKKRMTVNYPRINSWVSLRNRMKAETRLSRAKDAHRKAIEHEMDCKIRLEKARRVHDAFKNHLIMTEK